MNKDSLFHTEVVNDAGLSGEAYVKDGLRVMVSDPMSQDEGTNPEELFGLAWATCLNATIQAILKGRGIKARSKVEVSVDYRKEEKRPGFYFSLVAQIAVEGQPEDKVIGFMNSAHRLCPVSKIIGDYEHIKMTAVPYNI